MRIFHVRTKVSVPGILFLFFLIFLVWFSCIGKSPEQSNAAYFGIKNKLVNYHIPLKKLLDSLKINTNQISILVCKGDYRLYIRSDSVVIKSYPVVLGFNPVDDKLREGDGCTPEGKFKIRAKYPHKSWSKFIWFDYPNTSSRMKHNHAKKKGLIPRDAGIGGSVGIHGVPDGMDYLIDQKQNWTLGCVSLKNKDINEIYNVISLKTTIEIRK